MTGGEAASPAFAPDRFREPVRSAQPTRAQHPDRPSWTLPARSVFRLYPLGALRQSRRWSRESGPRVFQRFGMAVDDGFQIMPEFTVERRCRAMLLGQAEGFRKPPQRVLVR